jgi:hypothetical protein
VRGLQSFFPDIKALAFSAAEGLVEFLSTESRHICPDLAPGWPKTTVGILRKWNANLPLAKAGVSIDT